MCFEQCGNGLNHITNGITDLSVGELLVEKKVVYSDWKKRKADKRKLSVEKYGEIKKYLLKERAIEVLHTPEEMREIGTQGKMRFRCLILGCGFEWNTALGLVKMPKGTGCPDCANRRTSERCKLPVERHTEIKEYVFNERRIEVLHTPEEMREIGMVNMMNLRCAIESCNHEWKNSLGELIYGKKPVGCPKCGRLKVIAGSKFSVEKHSEIKRKLSTENKVEVLHTSEEMYKIGTQAKMWFQCLVEDCNYRWQTSLVAITKAKGRGCRRCSSKEIGERNKLPLEKYTKIKEMFLLERNVQILHSPEEMRKLGTKGRLNFLCLMEECGFEWNAELNTVKNRKSRGCPACHERKVWSDKYTDAPCSFVKKRCEFSVDDLKVDGRIDIAGIRQVLDDRDRLARETKIAHEVDHIVPMDWCNRSDIDEVVVLNNSINLRAITRQANQEKRNYLTDESLHEIILNPELFQIYKIASRKPLDVILRVNAYISNLVGLNDRRIFLALYPHLTYLLEEYELMQRGRRVAA
ncbi:hypothetical protein IQ250_07365 [Pseudanabaenaceae cyanobacterium LEGE 13415]|nr:hypothetical protein [Pseudanabaenaceae cyanobacterium LEGE 13415]